MKTNPSIPKLSRGKKRNSKNNSKVRFLKIGGPGLNLLRAALVIKEN